MATRVVIHTPSRVIRKITTNPMLALAPNESFVDVPDSFSITGGPWKLDVDNITKLTPSDAELDAAFTTPDSPEIAGLRLAIADINAEAGISPKIKTAFNSFANAFLKVRVRDMLEL